APSGWASLPSAAATTPPRSKQTVPAVCRSSEVTRRTPLFRPRSSSWKTSWMCRSLSGPSSATALPHRRAEQVVEIARGPRQRARLRGVRSRGIELHHALPGLNRLIELPLAGQRRALVVERAGTLGIEPEHPLERLERLNGAAVLEEGTAQRRE